MSPLAEGEAHVWRVRLDLGAGSFDLLSEDERARALRFHFSRDRDRFIAARAALRRILAGYLGAPPREIRFLYGPHGKPYLEESRLRFNLAHSEDLALCAVTREREVGVDVERIRPGAARERIPERFFSPREAAQLRALPPEAFFHYWALKEAYIKAAGEGLAAPLDSFDVSALEDPRWSQVSLLLGSDYAGALVVEGPLRRLILSDL